jgi:hypothetical protein
LNYLECNEIIDYNSPSIRQKALELSHNLKSDEEIAKSCFLFVRDEIRHTNDAKDNIITCKASEVLEYKTGWCFAKSHLLCTLLRANNIKSGFCYQRLSVNDNGEPYSLHGLNALYLEKYGWYRVDARGNKSGVSADFCPPIEKLAFNINLVGEKDFNKIFSKPLDAVVEFLQKYKTLETSFANLPDAQDI